MNDEDSFILRILKTEPPLKGDNAQSLKDWFNAIQLSTYGANVRHDPRISSRLMYIWLSQVKGIIIKDLEK